jgi:hypothetical protein
MIMQSPGSPNQDSFGTPPWEFQDKKTIRMWVPQKGTKYTIWGKVVAFPESRPW